MEDSSKSFKDFAMNEKPLVVPAENQFAKSNVVKFLINYNADSYYLVIADIEKFQALIYRLVKPKKLDIKIPFIFGGIDPKHIVKTPHPVDVGYVLAAKEAGKYLMLL